MERRLNDFKGQEFVGEFFINLKKIIELLSVGESIHSATICASLHTGFTFVTPNTG
jgi:hypothetical protein